VSRGHPGVDAEGDGVTLPKLMDCRAIMEELGVKRASADALMQQLPKVKVGNSKVFVRRADVERYLQENTRAA
jgi:hypothetical protein